MIQQSVEVLTARGGGQPPRDPRRWVIPAVVAAAAVLGAVSVPVLLAMTGSSTAAGRTATADGSPSARSAAPSAASVAPAAPVTAASRAPRASLALATPVPPNRVHVPAPQPTRSSPSGSGTGSAGPGTSASPSGEAGSRSGSLEPTSGPAGRLVTITGRCLPGTDTRYAAGAPGAAKHPLPADGRFTVRLQVAASGVQAGAEVQLGVQCLDAAGAVSWEQAFAYQVTGVAAVPDQVPGDAGQLGAPQTAPAGSTVTVSGSGFMAGAPVAFQVRNLDTGKVEASRQVLSDGGGSASATLALPGPGSIQVVAAGFDPGGGDRVLVATVTTS